MIPSNLVSVRFHRQSINPNYIDDHAAEWMAVAEELLAIYREAKDRTRSELADEITELVGSGVTTQVHQGLAKLLEDRCDYETVAAQPPEMVREVAFRLGAIHRAAVAAANTKFDRELVLKQIGDELGMTPAAVELNLFADLKDEQRIQSFEDITPERLLQRYNVAVAQSILLRSVNVEVTVTGETPARFRQLFRAIRFRRLIATIQEKPNGYTITLDGPLSLFSATQKYGLQLALFLPTLLLCKEFELTANLKWGAARKEKVFKLNSAEGLVSHAADYGVFTPKEFTLFAESFRNTIADWMLDDEPNPISLPDGVWVPDFTLTHTPTGKSVYLEIFGYWRRVDLEKHAARLKKHLPMQALIAITDSYRADDDAEPETFANVVRFKKTPNAEAIAAAAMKLIS